MKHSFLRIFGGVVAIIATFLLLQAPASAHKVNVFAYVENGTVHTESYFPDGKKVEGGAIEVFDTAGKRIVEGKTDRQGNFSFPVPAEKDDLRIVLNASMGHKASFLMKKSEM
jgi:nickel transport protein